MKDISTLTFHPLSEQIVDVLCNKTQNKNKMFFRTLLIYHEAKLAAMMRATILSKDRGPIPVNCYAINLAPSGQGKGHSTNIIEDQLTCKFRDVFFEETYPVVSENNLNKLGTTRAHIRGEDPDTVTVEVKREFEAMGQMTFSFDSATTAAVKQMRHKLLMADIGSMNLEIDEIGSNLLSNADVLGTFLELFDVGKVKNKLTKNTKENVRSEEIDGKTPTNLMLYGTPNKLLNGGRTEDEFYSFLETGYARRCFFGYTRFAEKDRTLTPKQIYDSLTDPTVNTFLQKVANDFGRLAHISNYNRTIIVDEKVSILLIEYKQFCEDLAEQLGEHEEIRKAELSHRYFKALKLAGTYAFIDGQPNISEANLYAAIAMVEASGKAFDRLLKRDRNYVKLAKYICSTNTELTHVDLTEDLPFYRGSGTQKAELMQLAIAWGYRHSAVIKKNFVNGIEFITGETLKPVDLDKIIISHSQDIADGYQNDIAPFDKLHKLTQLPNMYNFINHHVDTGHRHEDNIVPGFDMVVIDVDGGVSIDTVKLLLKNYKYHLYTTKRHKSQNHRFRLLLPMNYRLFLDEQDFKDFMSNVYDWLPFNCDSQSGQRSRKWLTCVGHHEYSTGDQLLDAMLFIPRTSKNEEQKKFIASHASLTNLERWFVTNTMNGNRSNQLIKYALLLVDMGHSIDQVRNNVIALNDKVPDKLEVKEIDSTIMSTAGKRIAKRGN